MVGKAAPEGFVKAPDGLFAQFLDRADEPPELTPPDAALGDGREKRSPAALFYAVGLLSLSILPILRTRYYFHYILD